MTTLTQTTGDFSLRLDALGFRRLRRLPVFRRGELYVAPGRDFWTISARAQDQSSLFANQIGKRGLWKLVGRPDGGVGWEFHLPARLFAGCEQFGREQNAYEEQIDDDQDLLSACLEWAEATLDGEIHSGWRPPEKKLLEEWLGTDRLTVQAGPLVRQGMVFCDERRLAVRFALVHQASPLLSPARRSWLDQTLTEAHNRWRMARVGYGGAGSHAVDAPAVSVEIDITGAPRGAQECLMKTGVDGLRWVVSWLLWPVGFLSDPSVTCSAWEIPPARAFGPQKGEGHA